MLSLKARFLIWPGIFVRFFVAIRGQRLCRGSWQGLTPRPSDPYPSALKLLVAKDW